MCVHCHLEEEAGDFSFDFVVHCHLEKATSLCVLQTCKMEFLTGVRKDGDDGFSTPRKSSIWECSSFIPNCEDGIKPVVGMAFDSLQAVEEFNKDYAHEAGFAVRIGQQNVVLDVVENKRFLCARQGYKKEKRTSVNAIGIQKKPKQNKPVETRCGCQAHIYVKLGADKRYYIASMVEEHNHGLVSPNKVHLLRSNRSISQRAKNTLFTCHKASIGTSQAYRLLQVTDGGIENVGCTRRDFQNYYRGLREKIKNADAQMFIA